jgi:GTP-binding protein
MSLLTVSYYSTLLQALTHSKSTVAPYAFTTLSPQIGTLIIYDDSTYSTTTSTTPIAESVPKTAFESSGRMNRLARPALKDARQERLRLTIADCPGLLPRASDNVGLGHDFLRHIERSKVLVFIVDLSGKDPVKDVEVLKQELEDYKEGLSERARIIVANKADRVDENDPDSVQRMKDKLKGLKKLASEWEELDGLERKVIPMSARHRGNVNLLVDNLVNTLGVSSTNGDEED